MRADGVCLAWLGDYHYGIILYEIEPESAVLKHLFTYTENSVKLCLWKVF